MGRVKTNGFIQMCLYFINASENESQNESYEDFLKSKDFMKESHEKKEILRKPLKFIGDLEAQCATSVKAQKFVENVTHSDIPVVTPENNKSKTGKKIEEKVIGED